MLKDWKTFVSLVHTCNSRKKLSWTWPLFCMTSVITSLHMIKKYFKLVLPWHGSLVFISPFYWTFSARKRGTTVVLMNQASIRDQQIYIREKDDWNNFLQTESSTKSILSYCIVVEKFITCIQFPASAASARIWQLDRASENGSRIFWRPKIIVHVVVINSFTFFPYACAITLDFLQFPCSQFQQPSWSVGRGIHLWRIYLTSKVNMTFCHHRIKTWVI